MSQNVFAEEWRDCLRAHYMHVVRTEDHVTLPTLTMVMHQAGFNDSELAELRVRATLRVEQVADDFVPELDVLATAPEDAPYLIAVPEMPAETTPIDESAELLLMDDEAALDATELEAVADELTAPLLVDDEAASDTTEPEAVADELTAPLLVDDETALDTTEPDESDTTDEEAPEPAEPEEPPPDPDAPQQLSLF